jgi:hypothetical protein
MSSVTVKEGKMNHYYAPTQIMTLHGTQPVTQYICHPPNTHKASPIVDDLVAVELKTPTGPRWFGAELAYINSELRFVVVRKTPPSNDWLEVPENLRVSHD